jgi:hypothetical protein
LYAGDGDQFGGYYPVISAERLSKATKTSTGDPNRVSEDMIPDVTATSACGHYFLKIRRNMGTVKTLSTSLLCCIALRQVATRHAFLTSVPKTSGHK